MHLLVPVMHLCWFTDSTPSIIIENPRLCCPRGLESLPEQITVSQQDQDPLKPPSSAVRPAPVPQPASLPTGQEVLHSVSLQLGSEVKGLRSALSELEVMTA